MGILYKSETKEGKKKVPPQEKPYTFTHIQYARRSAIVDITVERARRRLFKQKPHRDKQSKEEEEEAAAAATDRPEGDAMRQPPDIY